MSKTTEMLKRLEGFERHAYMCTAGFLTIGVGRNISKTGLGLSNEEIDYLLNNDIKRVKRELKANFDWFVDLNEPRRTAMISICFQLGLPALLKFSKALQAMEEMDYEEASFQFLESKWSTQTPGRAMEMAKIIRDGKYDSGKLYPSFKKS
mgnify:CR=1 FL=1|tara:strand:+ start:186 stop:638 length:453 start_codon:yes stop_codon:yes gene_type:complete